MKKQEFFHDYLIAKEREPGALKREFFYEGTTLTERSLEHYKEVLRLPVEDWKGKLVLDIGSSADERFSKQAAQKGIKVISLNPELKESEILNLSKASIWDSLRWKKKQRKSAAGIAQELPFKDNSFDAEVSVFGIPAYLPPYESEYHTTFKEIIRTLKHGSSAYFYPILEGLYQFSEVAVFDFEEAEMDVAARAWSGYRGERRVFRLTITKKSFEDKN